MDQQTDAAPLGGVDVKITHSTQGIALEVDAKRPREPGETFEQAAHASVGEAIRAYELARDQLAERGVAVGPFKKADKS